MVTRLRRPFSTGPGSEESFSGERQFAATRAVLAFMFRLCSFGLRSSGHAVVLKGDDWADGALSVVSRQLAVGSGQLAVRSGQSLVFRCQWVPAGTKCRGAESFASC